MFLSTGVQRFKGKCPQYYKYILQIELTRGLVQLVSMDGLKWKRNVVKHVTRAASSASLVTCRVMLYSRSPLSVWLVGVTGGLLLYFPLYISSSLWAESRPLNVCPINKKKLSHLTVQSSTTLCQRRSQVTG